MTTHAEEPNGSVLAYKVRQMGETIKELVNWRRDVDAERQDLRSKSTDLAEEMVKLQSAVDSLRKVLLGFAFTTAGSAIIFALTVLIATGKIAGHK